MAPQLPIELHEDIIDFVSRMEPSEHSRKALKQCSSTCRAWVPLAQRYLFRSYTLSRRSACPPFLEVLEKSTTGLAEHIRKLYLKTGVFDNNGIPFLATRRIIQCLVNLQTLHILTTVWPTREAISRITASEGLPLSTDAARLIGAPNLSTLRLRNVSFHSATDLIHLLAACPRLVALRFSGLRFASRTIQFDGVSELPFNTLLVECEGEDEGDLSAWFAAQLLGSPINIHLRHIEWEDTSPFSDDISLLLEVLRASEDSLEYCKVDTSFTGEQLLLVEPSDCLMARCPSLALGAGLVTSSIIDHPRTQPAQSPCLPQLQSARPRLSCPHR